MLNSLSDRTASQWKTGSPPEREPLGPNLPPALILLEQFQLRNPGSSGMSWKGIMKFDNSAL